MPTAAHDTGAHRILVKPIVSEKSYSLSSKGQYVFKVDQDANKISVRKAIEKLYGVGVSKINIMNIQGKARIFRGIKGKTSDWKKAIVTLKPGQTIAELNGEGVK